MNTYFLKFPNGNIQQPNTKQLLALISTTFETFFGGARGGGKTELLGMDQLLHALRYNDSAKGILIRRTYSELEEIIDKTYDHYAQFGKFNKTSKVQYFDNGAILRLRYLKSTQDADRYRGHNYTQMGVDEITNYPTPNPIDQMKATLRSSHGVPVRFIATGNPGSVGHQQVKNRYIDVAQPMKIFNIVNQSSDQDQSITGVFIPSRVYDNGVLMQLDPGYISRLRLVGNDDLIKAQIDGDWNVVAGSYFGDVQSHKLIIDPFDIPKDQPLYLAFDWGYSAPFSIGVYTVVPRNYMVKNRLISRNSLIRIDEYYGFNGIPNQGLKWSGSKIGAKLKFIHDSQKRKGYNFKVMIADPSIFSNNGYSRTIFGQLQEGQDRLSLKPAMNSRVEGQVKMRELMSNANEGEDLHQLFVFDTCREFIRTIPILQRSEINLDDVDTDMEDHIADECRYIINTIMDRNIFMTVKKY